MFLCSVVSEEVKHIDTQKKLHFIVQVLLSLALLCVSLSIKDYFVQVVGFLKDVLIFS